MTQTLTKNFYDPHGNALAKGSNFQANSPNVVTGSPLPHSMLTTQIQQQPQFMQTMPNITEEGSLSVTPANASGVFNLSNMQSNKNPSV